MPQAENVTQDPKIATNLQKLGFQKGIQTADDAGADDGEGAQDGDGQVRNKRTGRRSGKPKTSKTHGVESEERGSADASGADGDEDKSGDPDDLASLGGDSGDDGEPDDSGSDTKSEDDDLGTIEGDVEKGEDDSDLGDEDDPNSRAGLIKRLKGAKHLLAKKESEIGKLRDATQRQYSLLYQEIQTLKESQTQGAERDAGDNDGLDDLLSGNDGDVLTRADLKKLFKAREQKAKAKPKGEDGKAALTRQLNEIFQAFPNAKEINDYAQEHLASDPEFGMLRIPLQRVAFALNKKHGSEIKKAKKAAFDEGFKAARTQFAKGQNRDGQLPDAGTRSGGKGGGHGDGGGFHGAVSKTESRILNIGNRLGLNLKTQEQGR